MTIGAVNHRYRKQPMSQDQRDIKLAVDGYGARNRLIVAVAIILLIKRKRGGTNGLPSPREANY